MRQVMVPSVTRPEVRAPGACVRIVGGWVMVRGGGESMAKSHVRAFCETLSLSEHGVTCPPGRSSVPAAAREAAVTAPHSLAKRVSLTRSAGRGRAHLVAGLELSGAQACAALRAALLSPPGRDRSPRPLSGRVGDSPASQP